MRIVHHLVGYLQTSIGALFWVGAGIAHLLKIVNIFPLHELSEMNVWNKASIIAICLVSFVMTDKACEIFYTPEKYKEYVNGIMYGKGMLVPNPDTHFYLTMVDDIGIKRKFAGYVYALSKIIFCSILGAILYLGVRSVFTINQGN